jgi:HSP20 family protein
MNRLFDERGARVDTAVEGPFSPATDVYATDEAMVVTVELPGVADADVAVEVTRGELVVRGRRHFSGSGASYHRLERSFGEFRCGIALPKDAIVRERRVLFERGVVRVEIPRTRLNDKPAKKRGAHPL